MIQSLMKSGLILAITYKASTPRQTLRAVNVN